MSSDIVELAVYFANMKRLLNIDEALHRVDPEKIPSFVAGIMFSDMGSAREYYGNLVALNWLESALSSEWEIRRLYFGQEFCEYLIPSADDVEQAFFFSRQMGWAFTYVTGYLTDAGLDRTCTNFTRLRELAGSDENLEVVVNDWGVLGVLQQDFPTFEPVLGRLLTKQKRLARYTRKGHPPPISKDSLNTGLDEILRNQIEALRETAVSNPAYRQQLVDWGFRRVDLDIVPQLIALPANDLSLAYSCYYPWGYVTGGRNCLTAGVLDKRREFVATDELCPRPCQRFNRTPDLHHYPETMMQRGNSVFLFQGEYASEYLHGSLPMSRIVFEPYIPI